ncbi:ABC transporter permease [Roseivirga sp.]|uniref:ABC transporter permease n=1 Tax=Roseivirga sp. TaxID=1964215 RepID=UPI003B8C859D
MSKTKNISPPSWAEWFLKFYCKEEFLEEIQGDAYEIFERLVASNEIGKAKIQFIWNVLRFCRWSNMKLNNRSKFNQFTMVKNNFKIAYRNLIRNRFYTAINLTGISLGIACFILTFLYAQEEYSFDKFHSNYDNIYRVWVHETYDDEEYFEATIPVILGQTIKQDFPEIEETIQMRGGLATYISDSQEKIELYFEMVGEGFLKTFDFKFLVGDRNTALDKLENIVLTEKQALKQFGKLDVLGKTVNIIVDEKEYGYLVTGVVQDPPANSSITYGSLISDANNERFMNLQTRTAWYNSSSQFFVELNPNISVEALESKFPEMVKRGLGDEYEEGAFIVKLQPLSDVHFNEKIEGETLYGDLKTVRILSIVGFVILLLAGINFINLAVGQSLKRAKEVGVRKVMGAYKHQLVSQFLGESFLLTFMAMVLSIGVCSLLIPSFNQFADKNLTLDFSWSLVSALGIALLVIGLLSGIYPAFVLSSFNPVATLKSAKMSGKGKNGLAYSLIVVQFFAAIFFVSSTIIMKNQLSYLTEKDLGYEAEGMVYMILPRPEKFENGMAGIMNASGLIADQLITRLNQIPAISGATYANNYFGENDWMTLSYADLEDNWKEFSYNSVQEDFIKVFDIEIIEGKGFENATEYEQRTGFLINESFAKMVGLETTVGGKIISKRPFGEHQIIGVMKDFNFESLHKRIRPLMLSMNAAPVFEGVEGISMSRGVRATVLLKANLENFSVVRSQIETAWEERFAEPFDLKFVDAKLQALYEKERNTNAMLNLIAGLAITIACLGLLGLAALTIKNKYKEIGIRKVLGASSIEVFKLLYKLFMSPIIVAFIISVPLTVYVMNSWLSNFAYQINVNAFHFVIAAIGTIMLTLVVVSYQAIKAAATNPVDTIRYE